MQVEMSTLPRNAFKLDKCYYDVKLLLYIPWMKMTHVGPVGKRKMSWDRGLGGVKVVEWLDFVV